MDIKIENGDTVISESGVPKMISGIEQAIQQIKLSVEIPKGSFVYDRNTGAFAEAIDFSSENAKETVEMMINESLIATGAFVKVNYIENRQNNIYAGITVNNGYTTEDTEVILNGQL